ncbi:uncharacterized protein BJ171DRAFT_628680 [Polychytrium aggregatum]|uniref:uncharacterized protein n=1 Tax=Polychytrium aggregatum TaxID=110093 RepID=UPI0022FDC07E|nr:uncharacterized protein BJ171DRAFT_628680 [Polychytrium aggregatum]KAI9202254.1 hypothetical protein BJ171DRAFT_628680 [Polychytrium aggregatum]
MLQATSATSRMQIEDLIAFQTSCLMADTAGPHLPARCQDGCTNSSLTHMSTLQVAEQDLAAARFDDAESAIYSAQRLATSGGEFGHLARLYVLQGFCMSKVVPGACVHDGHEPPQLLETLVPRKHTMNGIIYVMKAFDVATRNSCPDEVYNVAVAFMQISQISAHRPSFHRGDSLFIGPLSVLVDALEASNDPDCEWRVYLRYMLVRLLLHFGTHKPQPAPGVHALLKKDVTEKMLADAAAEAERQCEKLMALILKCDLPQPSLVTTVVRLYVDIFANKPKLSSSIDTWKAKSWTLYIMASIEMLRREVSQSNPRTAAKVEELAKAVQALSASNSAKTTTFGISLNQVKIETAQLAVDCKMSAIAHQLLGATSQSLCTPTEAVLQKFIHIQLKYRTQNSALTLDERLELMRETKSVLESALQQRQDPRLVCDIVVMGWNLAIPIFKTEHRKMLTDYMLALRQGLALSPNILPVLAGQIEYELSKVQSLMAEDIAVASIDRYLDSIVLISMLRFTAAAYSLYSQAIAEPDVQLFARLLEKSISALDTNFDPLGYRHVDSGFSFGTQIALQLSIPLESAIYVFDDLMQLARTRLESVGFNRDLEGVHELSLITIYIASRTLEMIQQYQSSPEPDSSCMNFILADSHLTQGICLWNISEILEQLPVADRETQEALSKRLMVPFVEVQQLGAVTGCAELVYNAAVALWNCIVRSEIPREVLSPPCWTDKLRAVLEAMQKQSLDDKDVYACLASLLCRNMLDIHEQAVAMAAAAAEQSAAAEPASAKGTKGANARPAKSPASGKDAGASSGSGTSNAAAGLGAAGLKLLEDICKKGLDCRQCPPLEKSILAEVLGGLQVSKGGAPVFDGDVSVKIIILQSEPTKKIPRETIDACYLALSERARSASVQVDAFLMLDLWQRLAILALQNKYLDIAVRSTEYMLQYLRGKLLHQWQFVGEILHGYSMLQMLQLEEHGYPIDEIFLKGSKSLLNAIALTKITKRSADATLALQYLWSLAQPFVGRNSRKVLNQTLMYYLKLFPKLDWVVEKHSSIHSSGGSILKKVSPILIGREAEVASYHLLMLALEACHDYGDPQAGLRAADYALKLYSDSCVLPQPSVSLMICKLVLLQRKGKPISMGLTRELDPYRQTVIWRSLMTQLGTTELQRQVYQGLVGLGEVLHPHRLWEIRYGFKKWKELHRQLSEDFDRVLFELRQHHRHYFPSGPAVDLRMPGTFTESSEMRMYLHALLMDVREYGDSVGLGKSRDELKETLAVYKKKVTHLMIFLISSATDKHKDIHKLENEHYTAFEWPLGVKPWLKNAVQSVESQYDLKGTFEALVPQLICLSNTMMDMRAYKDAFPLSLFAELCITAFDQGVFNRIALWTLLLDRSYALTQMGLLTEATQLLLTATTIYELSLKTLTTLSASIFNHLQSQALNLTLANVLVDNGFLVIYISKLLMKMEMTVILRRWVAQLVLDGVLRSYPNANYPESDALDNCFYAPLVLVWFDFFRSRTFATGYDNLLLDMLRATINSVIVDSDLQDLCDLLGKLTKAQEATQYSQQSSIYAPNSACEPNPDSAAIPGRRGEKSYLYLIRKLHLADVLLCLKLKIIQLRCQQDIRYIDTDVFRCAHDDAVLTFQEIISMTRQVLDLPALMAQYTSFSIETIAMLNLSLDSDTQRKLIIDTIFMNEGLLQECKVFIESDRAAHDPEVYAEYVGFVLSQCWLYVAVLNAIPPPSDKPITVDEPERIIERYDSILNNTPTVYVTWMTLLSKIPSLIEEWLRPLLEKGGHHLPPEHLSTVHYLIARAIAVQIDAEHETQTEVSEEPQPAWDWSKLHEHLSHAINHYSHPKNRLEILIQGIEMILTFNKRKEVVSDSQLFWWAQTNGAAFIDSLIALLQAAQTFSAYGDIIISTNLKNDITQLDISRGADSIVGTMPDKDSPQVENAMDMWKFPSLGRISEITRRAAKRYSILVMQTSHDRKRIYGALCTPKADPGGKMKKEKDASESFEGTYTLKTVEIEPTELGFEADLQEAVHKLLRLIFPEPAAPPAEGQERAKSPRAKSAAKDKKQAAQEPQESEKPQILLCADQDVFRMPVEHHIARVVSCLSVTRDFALSIHGDRSDHRAEQLQQQTLDTEAGKKAGKEKVQEEQDFQPIEHRSLSCLTCSGKLKFPLDNEINKILKSGNLMMDNLRIGASAFMHITETAPALLVAGGRPYLSTMLTPTFQDTRMTKLHALLMFVTNEECGLEPDQMDPWPLFKQRTNRDLKNMSLRLSLLGMRSVCAHVGPPLADETVQAILAKICDHPQGQTLPEMLHQLNEKLRTNVDPDSLDGLAPRTLIFYGLPIAFELA